MIFVFALLISISFFMSVIGFVMDNDLSVIGLFMAIIFLLYLYNRQELLIRERKEFHL